MRLKTSGLMPGTYIIIYINSAHCARQPRLRRNTHIGTAAAGPALRESGT